MINNIEKICKICGKEFETLQQLRVHIRTHGLYLKKYYDQFYKKENEGQCLTCGKKTKFRNINIGYAKFCNKECSRNYKII